MENQTSPRHPAVTIENDPIVAIATAVGESAIAIVRTSGKGTLQQGDQVFRKKGDPSFSFTTAQSHTAHFGYILSSEGEILDEVMAIVYKAPKSFTTEDSIEINCHGGVVVTQAVLKALVDAGFRLAEPGEFTRRAFLAGRIDLLQAEAIGELIHAKTDAAYRAALTHLKGDLSKALSTMREDLLYGCALLELELDFGEEDVEFQSRDQLLTRLSDLQTVLTDLESSFQLGKKISEGVFVALVGRPNAGKSTLLNALLGKSRAIVSDTPGTTRDYIQESFMYDGVLFQLIDTAGLRQTKDAIEEEGIRRSVEKIEEADLVLYLYDASMPLSEEEKESIHRLRQSNPQAAVLVIGNKADKVGESQALASELMHEMISAKTGDGLAALKERMKALTVGSHKRQEGSLMLTNMRHYEAVRNALRSLRQAKRLTETGRDTELIASDLRDALDHIGTITGKVATDDILNTIFARFCIGK